MLQRARQGHRIDTSSALQHLRSLGTIVLRGPFGDRVSLVAFLLSGLRCLKVV